MMPVFIAFRFGSADQGTRGECWTIKDVPKSIQAGDRNIYPK